MGFGVLDPPGPKISKTRQMPEIWGVPDLFKMECFLNVQRGTRGCQKMHKMSFFPEVSRQFWIKKYKKIRNFYKNCCFSGWHPGEGKLNIKNTKKWVFRVWVGKWEQLFLINFFEKNFWQFFFDLKNRQFFDFLKIFKKNIEFFRTSFRRRVALGFLLKFHENFIKKKL